MIYMLHLPNGSKYQDTWYFSIAMTFSLLEYTGCPRNGQNFGRVFLMLNYTDITQNTYIQS